MGRWPSIGGRIRAGGRRLLAAFVVLGAAKRTSRRVSSPSYTVVTVVHYFPCGDTGILRRCKYGVQHPLVPVPVSVSVSVPGSHRGRTVTQSIASRHITRREFGLMLILPYYISYQITTWVSEKKARRLWWRSEKPPIQCQISHFSHSSIPQCMISKDFHPCPMGHPKPVPIHPAAEST